jgi:hypothetical protein
MKLARARRVAPPTPAEIAARRHDQARQQLRAFAKFVERHDPEILAALVTEIDSTLTSCARIDRWFQRYAAALRLKVVH